MLILVGVTINFAINGGIINKAKEAGKQTQIAADREALLSCVIASMGLDGKVDFTELDQEILKIGFTGSNGTYTSPSGNVFTVDEDGNITSEGESSGGGSSSADADLTYLKNTLEGQSLLDVCDMSGMVFNDSDISIDFVAVMSMGSPEGNIISYPILYKGRSYSLSIDISDGSNPMILGVTENAANNANADLNYLRTNIGKTVNQVATQDPNTNDLAFNDSNITFSSQYSGSPIQAEDGVYIIYISYNGNDYSVALRDPGDASSIYDYIVYAVMEGIYQVEQTPVSTD